VASVQGAPEIANIPIRWCGISRNGAAVICFHRVDNALESENLVQKLGMLGEEDLTEQCAGASGERAQKNAALASGEKARQYCRTESYLRGSRALMACPQKSEVYTLKRVQEKSFKLRALQARQYTRRLFLCELRAPESAI